MKISKKILALILCLTMIISSSVVLISSADDSDTAGSVSTYGQSAEDYPIVFVTGIGQSYSYLYANEEDAQADIAANETDRAVARWNLFCNDFSFAFKEPATWFAILRVVGTLLLSMITGHNFVSKSAVDKLVTILFRYNTVDENGKLPPVVVTPRMYYPVSQYTEEQRDNFYRTIPCQDVIGDIGEDNLYCFNYSAFSDTYNNSDDLNVFINDYVLPQTGKDKVILIPMSMGASVVSAYLQDYGTKAQVARVVSIVGAWYGSDVFADLIEQNYASNAPELLYNGIVSDLVGEPWGNLVNVLLRIFPKATLRSIIDEILGSVVENLVLKTPSLTALIPYQNYQRIREAKLANNPELGYVLKTADKYYQAQINLGKTVTNLHNNYGVDFYFIAGYGLIFGGYSSDYQFFQFFKHAETTNSDEIIQISSTIPEAKYMPVGKEFDNAYLNLTDTDYVSPDKSVDISSTFFPDNCWLFYKQKHELEYNNTALKLALDLARGAVTSSKDSAYPRFNESRDLKRLDRNYIPDLEKWLETNSLSSEQQALLDSNNAAVAQMKDSVVNNREEDDKVIQAYYDMLVSFGVYEASDDKESIGSKILGGLNDTVYKIFGAKGFVDIFSK